MRMSTQEVASVITKARTFQIIKEKAEALSIALTGNPIKTKLSREIIQREHRMCYLVSWVQIL